MGKIQREVYQCDQCGYEWIPETSTKPERCAKRGCRSRKWDSGKDGSPRSDPTPAIVAQPKKPPAAEPKAQQPTAKSATAPPKAVFPDPMQDLFEDEAPEVGDGIVHEREFCQDPNCAECRRIRLEEEKRRVQRR